MCDNGNAVAPSQPVSRLPRPALCPHARIENVENQTGHRSGLVPTWLHRLSLVETCSVFAVCAEQLPGGGGREFQRLVGYACLLAEMYNYAVVGSPTVFETLHLLLDSGHEVSAARDGACAARTAYPVPCLRSPPVVVRHHILLWHSSKKDTTHLTHRRLQLGVTRFVRAALMLFGCWLASLPRGLAAPSLLDVLVFSRSCARLPCGCPSRDAAEFLWYNDAAQ